MHHHTSNRSVNQNTRPCGANSPHRRQIAAVDLFCGAGGLTCGLKKAGIRMMAGVDLDPSCRYPLETNNATAFHQMDIGQLTADQVAVWYPKQGIRLLAGCAPCQPFSSYTQGRDPRSDEKWGLLQEFGRIAAELRPDLITIENVPQLTKHDVYHDFTDKLEDMGYFISDFIVNCPDYGIPQTRRRLVLFASRFGKVLVVPPTHASENAKTVRQTIETMPAIEAGQISPVDSLHRTSTLSQLNMKRMRASRPGGTWRDWEIGLIAGCHRKKKGKTYPGVYGRMAWDEPSPTITTQFYGFGNGRFGHPEQDRAISLREGALLQTFPPEYAFFDPDGVFSMTTAGRLIGNAVPVRLGEVVGLSLVQHVEVIRG